MMDGRRLFDEAYKARTRLTKAAAIAAGVVLLLFVTGVGATIKLKIYDAWFSLRGAQEPSQQIAIVSIDGKSINKIGRFPFRRDKYVPLLEELNRAGAKVIGFDMSFSPDPDDPDSTRKLADAFRTAGNVVFGVIFNHPGDTSPVGTEPDPAVRRNAVSTFDDVGFDLVPYPELERPDPLLAQAAVALGHVNAQNDKDDRLRAIPVLIKHGRQAYPGIGLQMARIYVGAMETELEAADGVLPVDYADVPLDTQGYLQLNYTSTEPAFPTYSMADVLDSEYDPGAFDGKAVLIGMTAEGMDDRNFFGRTGPGVLMHATFLDNFFRIDFLRTPGWTTAVDYALVFGLLGLGVFLWPRLQTGVLLGIGPAVVVALLAISALFFIKGIWLEPFYPALAVLLPWGATVALKLRETEKEATDVKEEKADTQKTLGLSYQEKGLLDMALATFNKLPMSQDMKGIYLSLGIDFENRGQRDKAFLAYKRLYDVDPNYEDIGRRIEASRQAGAGTRAFVQPTMLEQAAQAQVQPGAAAPVGDAIAATAAGPSGDPDDADATMGLAPTQAGQAMQPTMARAGEPTQAGVAAQSTRNLGAEATQAPGSVGGGVPAAVGQAFGRYKILKKLGRGAMGDVFMVEDEKIGRKAAMKTIRVDVEMSPAQAIEMRQRFYREAQTAGKLTHPNIVTIHDVGEEQGTSYIVMEFVEGDTLTGLMKKHRLSVAQIKHVITQAAMGIDFAHENGVFHRDIKPDNIMVSSTGVVKVMDFGIARLIESDMTRTGSILGTPAYMAPEQFAGKKVDARSDIFSLGVVLYEMVTRARPFDGDTPTAVMFAIIQKDPAQPSAASEGVNELWDPIIMKALAKAPEERYASAKEFAEAIVKCQAK